MTGRERLDSIFHKAPVDGLSWTALVDDHSLKILPEPLRGMNAVDFYRHVGCDVLMLNTWGTPHQFTSPRFAWGGEVTKVSRSEDLETITEWRTAGGTLTAVSRSGHPVKYPVTSLDDVRIYRGMWENARWSETDDEDAWDATNEAVGDDGVVVRFWEPTPVPRLLQLDMGVEAFYHLLAEHPGEMAGLIELIHERELAAFEILGRGPWVVVILTENTSTYYISPDVYERFNAPHVSDFVEIMHGAGKTAIVHMCGHVRDLLPTIKETGLDGIHALTPPPTGNTPWELALDVLGEDQVIVGALDPAHFIAGPIERIGETLDALYTPRLRRANFILCAFADGIAVPVERFYAVRDWFQHNS